MVLCRIEFHFKNGECGLDVVFIQELPECVASVGLEIGFDDLPHTIHGVVSRVNWWASSEAIELETLEVESNMDLDALGKSLLDDDRVVFVEYSRGDEGIWSETRG